MDSKCLVSPAAPDKMAVEQQLEATSLKIEWEAAPWGGGNEERGYSLEGAICFVKNGKQPFSLCKHVIC